MRREKSWSPASWSFAALVMLSQCVCQNNRLPEGEPVKPVEGTTETTRATQPAATSPTAGDPTKPAKPSTPAKLPAGLDTKDLDEAEKAELAALLSEQYDPCGKDRSFLASLEDATTCTAAKKLAALAVTKLAQGLSKKQVVQELLKEQARWASHAEFDLTGVPVYGEPGPGKRVIVEFSDFQCPHCKLAAKPAKELAKKHNAVLYAKQLPLDFHPVARKAALMALAAHRQGKYWEVSQALFDNQELLADDKLRGIVEKAGVDMARLDKDLADPEIEKALQRDLDEATKLQIDGTPTFYVDGFKVEYEQLGATLEAPPEQH